MRGARRLFCEMLDDLDQSLKAVQRGTLDGRSPEEMWLRDRLNIVKRLGKATSINVDCWDLPTMRSFPI
jgi:hypothetical protein